MAYVDFTLKYRQDQCSNVFINDDLDCIYSLQQQMMPVRNSISTVYEVHISVTILTMCITVTNAVENADLLTLANIPLVYHSQSGVLCQTSSYGHGLTEICHSLLHSSILATVFGSAHTSSKPVTTALWSEWMEMNALFAKEVILETHADEESDCGHLEIACAQPDCYHGGISGFYHAF